jgi:hypothetical protein
MTEYGRIHTDGSRSGGQPTQSDALKVAREALEGMIKYAGMRESWQEDNPQYVEAVYDAIDVIDAAMQEQIK